MLSVICKEWRSYFFTPTGYVFVAIFWLLSTAFFFLYNILAATADLSALFGNLSYLFMLIVPLLTMRLFSEERRQKTDQLFYCSPVSLLSVVGGKFLAAMGVLVHGVRLNTLEFSSHLNLRWGGAAFAPFRRHDTFDR